MISILKTYFSVIFNIAAGWYLYVTPELHVFVKFLIIFGVALFAVLSIIALGIMSLGWTFMMKDISADAGYEPGGDRARQMYDTTLSMIKGYTSTQFYISFLASIGLMAGLMAQGWIFLLALEVAGSAIGYGFIHWVMNNTTRMKLRAYGETETND